MNSPSFLGAFERVMGANARNELVRVVGQTPIVLISGDQCTGKGTAAALLVDRLGAQHASTGGVLRAMAREHGIGIEAMSALLSGKSVHNAAGERIELADLAIGTAEDVDVRLDYRAAMAIMRGTLDRSDGHSEVLSVFESRLAGQLGRLLSQLGRRRLLSVYLVASPPVQAERYMVREVFEPMRARGVDTVPLHRRAREILSNLEGRATLEDALQALLSAGLDGVEAIADRAASIAQRDHHDRTRLLALYGVDYQDPGPFHLRIDTDRLSPQAVVTIILTALTAGDGQS
jgi:cytidylate kinase